jgi:hypothetical protein
MGVLSAKWFNRNFCPDGAALNGTSVFRQGALLVRIHVEATKEDYRHGNQNKDGDCW